MLVVLNELYEMINKKQVIIFTVVTIIVAAFSFLLIPYLVTKQSWGWNYSTETGYIGDTIGGTVGPTVGFIGVILTFLAFYIQYQANKIQLKTIADQAGEAAKNDRLNAVQQTENTFFELLRLHRDNVKEMNFRKESGRKVLTTITHQFYNVINYINTMGASWSGALQERDKINIAYLITYFGVVQRSHNPLGDIIQRYYPNLKTDIDQFVKNVDAHISAFHKEQISYMFFGHQSRLGHYYRHLFMMINFVHEDKVLNDDEKRKYIKFVRAQLSTQEQILFFFNSISILGEAWELGSAVSESHKLVTQYGLIRNISPKDVHGFNPDSYYPNIKFELNFE